MLSKITPNIGLWPSTEAQPLARYLASLRQLKMLDVRLALPGHGPLISNWRGRLSELEAHHQTRLEHMLDAVGTGATALEVSRTVFNFDSFSQHEVRFAVAETLAHLEHLVMLKQLTYVEENVRIYRRIDN